MFGTVFRARPKPGGLEKIMKLNEEEATRRGAIKGWIRTYILEESSGDIWGTVIFESEEAYRANASDPEQDKWYGRMRELLEGDPEWHDGVIREEPGR